MTRKMTEGSPAKLIVLFTIPLVLGNIFQQLYSIADTLIVGRILGINALAAVGCTASVSSLFLGFVMGITSGLSIITAQRFGAKDYEGVRRSVAVSIWISLVVTVILTVISVSFARKILELMKTPPEIIEQAYEYIVVIFIGIGATMLFNLLSNIIRALGDSKRPLIFLVISSILSIVLDYVFILVWQTGVAGAAWATVIAQLVAGLLCLGYIRKTLPILQMKREDFKISRFELHQHLRVALPIGLQQIIISIGSVILQFALNGLGALSVAAFTAAQKIDQIAGQLMNSFGMTMVTFTAQNYGAGQVERIRKGVLQCSIISVSISIIMGLINIFAGHQLASVFVGQEATEVLRLVQIYFMTNSVLYPVLALLFIFRYTIQGLGRAVMPTVAGIMEFLMRTIAALFLTAKIGFMGACLASPLAWIGAGIVVVIDYFRVVKGYRQHKETL